MILRPPGKIYISSANVDMRKSIDGLSSIVGQKFQLDMFSDAMFVFHNRHCDKIKILYWDGNGFCLLYKRMEKEKFRFPKHISDEVYSITKEELLILSISLDTFYSKISWVTWAYRNKSPWSVAEWGFIPIRAKKITPLFFAFYKIVFA